MLLLSLLQKKKEGIAFGWGISYYFVGSESTFVGVYVVGAKMLRLETTYACELRMWVISRWKGGEIITSTLSV